MADKLLIGSLVISMGYCDLIPVWLAGTVLFRDVFLIAAGFVIRYISLPPPVSIFNYYFVTNLKIIFFREHFQDILTQLMLLHSWSQLS